MDIPAILNTIRDPVLTIIVASIMLYIVQGYVKKSDFEEHTKKTEEKFAEIHEKFVSKEKLGDVMRPMADSLLSMKDDISEIKKFLLEAIKR